MEYEGVFADVFIKHVLASMIKKDDMPSIQKFELSTKMRSSYSLEPLLIVRRLSYNPVSH